MKTSMQIDTCQKKSPHLRYHAKMVEVHMAFQMRGGTYKWAPRMHKIKRSLEKNSENQRKIKRSQLHPSISSQIYHQGTRIS